MERTLRLGGRLALFGAGLGIAYWQLQGRFNPQAHYAVEHRKGGFEIRRYEASIRAETAIVATDWSEALHTGFERLAHYISGGNRRDQRIAMTGPVTQSAERVAVFTPVTHHLPHAGTPPSGLSNGLAHGALDEHRPPATAPGAAETALGATNEPTDELEEHAGSVPSWIMSFAMPADHTLSMLPIPRDPRVRLRPLPERRIATLRFTGRYTPLRIGDKARELVRRVQAEGLVPRGPVEFAGYDPPTTLPFLRRNEVWVELDPAA